MSMTPQPNRCCAINCGYGKTTNTDFCMAHWSAIAPDLRQELIDTRVYTSGYPSQLSPAYDPWLKRAIEYLSLKEVK